MPEMMHLLEEAFDLAEPGSESVVDLPQYNRHRKMKEIILRTGFEPWSDLFQHLRRCCRTQLLNEGLPPHAASRWLGHGQRVGDEHYTILTDDLFEGSLSAQQKAQRKEAESSGIRPKQTISLRMRKNKKPLSSR